jgi:hypothetical protein
MPTCARMQCEGQRRPAYPALLRHQAIEVRVRNGPVIERRECAALPDFVGETRKKAQGCTSRPRTEAEAAHAKTFELGDGRNRRIRQHIQRTFDSPRQPGNGLSVVDAGCEERIGAGLAIGFKTPHCVIEAT